MAATETAEQVREQPDVKKELERTGRSKAPPEKVRAQARDKFWFFTHALLLIGLIALEWLLRLKLVPVPQGYFNPVQRWVHAAILCVIVVAFAKAVSVYLFGRIEDASTRFTLKRVEYLIVGVILALIVVSAVFVNWYPALTALGIGSIIIGLAVQTPAKSFIAWIFILVRQPFRVGDRIQIGDATGDVIDVGYLDTTLWEFGGKYISVTIRAVA